MVDHPTVPDKRSNPGHGVAPGLLRAHVRPRRLRGGRKGQLGATARLLVGERECRVRRTLPSVPALRSRVHLPASPRLFLVCAMRHGAAVSRRQVLLHGEGTRLRATSTARPPPAASLERHGRAERGYDPRAREGGHGRGALRLATEHEARAHAVRRRERRVGRAFVRAQRRRGGARMRMPRPITARRRASNSHQSSQPPAAMQSGSHIRYRRHATRDSDSARP